MKLILYKDKGHHKNFDAIQRMCNSSHIEFEFTDNENRIKQDDYEILYSFSHYVNPDILPPKVKIIFGPHAFVIPSNESPFVGSTDFKLINRAVYNCLSKWNYFVFYENVVSFKLPVHQLPFAVNINRFKPINNPEKDLDCLIYIKNRSNTDRTLLNNILNNSNLKYETITYGSYNEDQYINLLNRSKFMIVLDAHESQGFALQEAMSCNVPLLVIDATSMYDEYYYGKQLYLDYKPKLLKATSVPYWSEECGLKTTFEELPEKIQIMKDSWSTFTPRNYIVRELSEVPCMKRILDIFGLAMPI